MKIKAYETLIGILKKYRYSSENSIDYENAKKILESNKLASLIDVRSPQEYKEGNLQQSINIPLYDIAEKIDNIIPNKEIPIIVYCQSGSRSKKAMNILIKKGYINVYNILGGIDNI